MIELGTFVSIADLAKKAFEIIYNFKKKKIDKDQKLELLMYEIDLNLNILRKLKLNDKDSPQYHKDYLSVTNLLETSMMEVNYFEGYLKESKSWYEGIFKLINIDDPDKNDIDDTDQNYNESNSLRDICKILIMKINELKKLSTMDQQSIYITGTRLKNRILFIQENLTQIRKQIIGKQNENKI